ncbi:MAG: DUF2236 domain-containing protein [Myxococcota bacterium]|nr:DUF2236 domain-containing protein [Myxococcota bacterium]
MSVVTVNQLEASLAQLRAHVADPRAGILGPRSIAWHVGGDLGLFVGGGRAALLQLAHPMVAHAIDHHSRTRADVIGRFQRTFKHVFAMVFGELDDAFAAARRVHAIDTRVHGTMPVAIGGWAAGTPYHANDDAALRWVHATLVDTTLVVRERLDGALSIDHKDRYVIEMNRFAALFGIPRALLPDSWAAHAAYMARMIGSDRLAVSPAAKEMARFLIGRGVAQQPALGRITEAVTHALLPPHLAEQFELRGSPRLARSGLATFARVYRQLPRFATAIPAAADAHRRLAGQGPSKLAAWTERQLFELAHRATGT